MRTAGSARRTRRSRSRPTTSTMSACCTARPTSLSAVRTGRPGPNAPQKFRKGILRYEGEQLFPGDRTAPPQAAALMLIGMNVAPEHEHEFNEWYNTEHIPALGSAPGTLCARRYRGTGGIQRYVALYHLTSPEVVRSAEWKKAADTPWTQKMRPHFRDHLRIECRRYTRAQ